MTSPNYPGDYPHGLDKTFTIEGSPGKVLQMTFVDFDIKNIRGCAFDWLQVTARTCSDVFS